MTNRLLVFSLAILVLVPAALRAGDDEGCPPLPESALKRIAQVMDLVQEQKADEAFTLADAVVSEHPCHTTYQARASCLQLLRKHRAAIADFRKAYSLVQESYDLEGMARSAIAVGDINLALQVGRALKKFPYKSKPERARGLRCVDAIAAAGNMLLDTQEARSEHPVSHRSEPAEESE